MRASLLIAQMLTEQDAWCPGIGKETSAWTVAAETP